MMSHQLKVIVEGLIAEETMKGEAFPKFSVEE